REFGITEQAFIFSTFRRETMLLVYVGLDECAFVIIDDNRCIQPMCNVALDMPDHRRDIDLLKENVFNLDQRSVWRTGMDFLVKNLNGNFFAVLAGFDVLARQLNPGQLAVSDGGYAQQIRDAKGG